MIGLPKEAILSMIMQDIPDRPQDEVGQYIRRKLLPNIAEAIDANNEAILFALKDD